MDRYTTVRVQEVALVQKNWNKNNNKKEEKLTMNQVNKQIQCESIQSNNNNNAEKAKNTRIS